MSRRAFIRETASGRRQVPRNGASSWSQRENWEFETHRLLGKQPLAPTLFRRFANLGRFVAPYGDGLQEVVGDKGYHSNQELIDLEAVGIRSYISEPDRGRRHWTGKAEARAAVYRNRRRIHGARGQRVLRLRGERLERPFAHLYETGGLRRVYLRGHANILKRVLIHAGGLNLGLLMRHLIGVGTPRSLQGRAVACVRVLWSLVRFPETLWKTI